MNTDAMLHNDDLDGYAIWQRHLRMVRELQRAELGLGVALLANDLIWQ